MPMESVVVVAVLVLRLQGLLLRLLGLLEQQHRRCHQLLGLHLVHLGGDSPPCTPSSADVVAVGRRRVVGSAPAILQKMLSQL